MKGHPKVERQKKKKKKRKRLREKNGKEIKQSRANDFKIGHKERRRRIEKEQTE